VSRRLRVLGLGDETAGGLGVRVERTRLLALAVAVALAALATAFAGPVAFVAFVSAPIARRLLPTAGAVLLPAGLVGAAVILGAELAAQYLVPSLEAAVGIITGAVGACYLLWLLAAADRRGETAGAAPPCALSGSPSPTTAAPSSPTSTSPSRPVPSPSSSAPTAAASPRCCAACPGCCGPPPVPASSTAATCASC